MCFSFGFSTTFLLLGKSFNVSSSQYLDLKNKGLSDIIYKVPSSSRMLFIWACHLSDLSEHPCHCTGLIGLSI